MSREMPSASLTRKLVFLGRQMLALASELGSDERGIMPTCEEKSPPLPEEGHPCLFAAQMHLRERSLRSEFFPKNFFGEPAWDMLLDLYVAEKKNKLISTTSAGLASNASTTTALRWLRALEEAGYVYRFPDAKDARRTFVRITERGYAQVTSYLVATRRHWAADGAVAMRW